MTIFDNLERIPVLKAVPVRLQKFWSGAGELPVLNKLNGYDKPLLVQEQPGFHLGIAAEIKTAGRQAAQIAMDRYEAWLSSGGKKGDTEFKRQYFTIAVGGGNTLKNQYKALLKHHFRDINWLDHVRFFFLEETCNEKNWESSRDGLVATFIEPLAKRLIATRGTRELSETLGLKRSASHGEIVEQIVELMTFSIDIKETESSVKAGDRQLALEKATREARRYQSLLRKYLGPDMSFHLIISGIGKDGGIGAFTPRTPELKRKKPAAMVLDKPNGAISVALNRGVLAAADCISLIISGNLKLRAFGRFEMEDSADFEQTVMETPIRMLRETREMAEKVYIFADERALHFEEGLFRYKEKGKTIEIKSEFRDGDEEQGIHILLVHGFMGLYTYINLLIRLPRAWRVSALRRGTHAKTLPDAEVFPHYANSLRKMILRNWRSRRPTPTCYHSMGGVVSDHLLLSVLKDYSGELPDFEQLKGEDRRLIEALRAVGMIHIATWAPSDTCHIRQNFALSKAYKSGDAVLDFSGPEEIYNMTRRGDLVLNAEHNQNMVATPAALEKLIASPVTESVVTAINVTLRFILKSTNVRKFIKQKDSPYGQRLLGDRVLKKVSFYGVLKEGDAAMHHPQEYQNRHVKALEAIIKYDIPYLSIIHQDDFMVSANRHVQEHEYLLAERLKKEGVSREQDLKVPASLILLQREEEELPFDMINPHFLILSTTHEGPGHDRMVTEAITRFVKSNVTRAIDAGQVKPLASIDKWRRTNMP